MRNSASLQLYALEDDMTGDMSTPLKPADVRMALTNHSVTWDKNAFPLCCLSVLLTAITGTFYVKLLALEDMRSLGLELDEAAIVQCTVCVRSCTRSEGCLTMIEIVLDCPDECSISVN